MFRTLLIFLGLSACVMIPLNDVDNNAPALAGQAASAPAFERLLNEARATPVSANGNLTAAANTHAADMVANGYFSHASLNGARVSDRVAAQGLKRCSIAENIADGQRTQAEVFAAWMSSPSHRAHMLNPKFQSYGLGRADNKWVLVLYKAC